MKRTVIEIHGDNSPVLSVGLSDILKKIDGLSYYWSIHWLEATGKLEKGNMLELEDQIKKAKKGKLVSWDDLMNLSNQLDQGIEMFIVADRNKLKFELSKSEQEDACDLTIELIDSTLWSISFVEYKYLNVFTGLAGFKYAN